MNTDEIKEDVLRLFDERVSQLSQFDYKELLDELIGDLEARLQCIKEELADGLAQEEE